MQLSHIILENRAMLPPMFDDVQLWVEFRVFMNSRFNIKAILQHWLCEIVFSTLIVLAFINALYFSFNPTQLVQIFDTIFIWWFVFELIFRIIGIGPEHFFASRWNNLDAFLVAIGVVFFFLPVSSNASSIARIGRIFRVASLLRLMSHSNSLQRFRSRFL
jgi:hypothetical protein